MLFIDIMKFPQRKKIITEDQVWQNWQKQNENVMDWANDVIFCQVLNQENKCQTSLSLESESANYCEQPVTICHKLKYDISHKWHFYQRHSSPIMLGFCCLLIKTVTVLKSLHLKNCAWVDESVWLVTKIGYNGNVAAPNDKNTQKGIGHIF